MFKTIIVGVDFSDYSRIVVKQAKLLSKIWKTKMILVHSVHDPVEYTPYAYMTFPNLLTDDDYANRIKKTYDIKANTAEIVIGRALSPSKLIQKVAHDNSDSLVVVGHKSQSRFEDFFFGSTAQSLALNSKLSVWIHRGSKVVTPKKVLIPHDLSSASNKSIDVIKEMSLATPMSYEAFFIKEKYLPVLEYKSNMILERKILDETQNKIQNLLKDYPKINFSTAKGNVTTKIVKRTKKFDLLVLAHHNPTGLFSKSETAELLTKVKTPILVIH